MDEIQFWSLIDSAWPASGEISFARRRLVAGSLSSDDYELLVASVHQVASRLKALLDKLSDRELLAFDQVLERKLYDIDRAEIQEYTDGSDDGFLYARGFIVVAGKQYYDAVIATPKRAIMDLECEEMCYLPQHLYCKKFGEPPKSELSRESGSNKAGWPDDDL